MKKLFSLVIISALFFLTSYGQYIQDSRIDSIVSLISQQKISKYIRELSGDTTTVVGGVPRLIFSRYYTSPANVWAAQYIYEKFQSFGLNPSYWTVDSLCKNVLAVKTGTKFPNQKIIIGAHYDNILWEVPGPLDTVYGADDNTTGVSGVLEAARLLANMNFPYTIVFAAWDQEENNNVWGAQAYADSAYLHGDSIKAYINMDMLGWNDNNQNKFWTGQDSISRFFNDIFRSLRVKYIPNLTDINDHIANSDNLSFIEKNFRTFSVCEFNVYNNPNWHMITDTYSNIDLLYCTSIIKPTVALLMVLASNKNAFYEHKALSNTFDTIPRVATAIIQFPNKVSVSNSAPRLYFKTNNEPFSYLNAFYNNLDTFKFLIPGKPRGSVIKYYLAARDSIENFACTYPVGGSGINPPGTTPPENLFTYEIYTSVNICSNTLPKPINDFLATNDTIQINQNNKLISKLTINLTIYHPNDGDLIIQLKGPGGTVNLSQGNGSGGANYINTTFDDSASTPITQGTPPFTGSFKPQSPLTFFNNKPASDSWVLRVFDSKAGNTGTLVSWCIIMQLKNNVGIKEEFVPLKFELHQNYPNPFNPTTNIKYQIAKSGFVTLKIYDILGKEIQTLVSEKQDAGEYEIIFNGSRLPSGVYFYEMRAGNYKETKRMVLLK